MKCKLVRGNSEKGVQKTGTFAYLVLLGVIMIFLTYFLYHIINNELNMH